MKSSEPIRASSYSPKCLEEKFSELRLQDPAYNRS
jgi:hypothetical protein